MIAVPDEFRRFRLAVTGEPARAWLDRLPATVDELCRRWRLTIDGPVANGAVNLVVPVSQDGERLALKVCWREHDLGAEISALRAWNGQGAVLLYGVDAELSAVLLERLDASVTLASLELAAAGMTAGALIRELAVPPPPDIPRLAAILTEIAGSLREKNSRLGHPVPLALVDRAVASAESLAQENAAGGSVLVHADLHYGNVLGGIRRRWLAIDPRAVAGHPEYSVPELMWTRADDAPDGAAVRAQLARVAEAGELDLGRATEYTAIRCVDYWLWALDNGLTIDPVRCARVLDALP